MKMQDKLIKYNHKAPYYRMKKCAISFAVFIGLSVSVAVPTSFVLSQEQIPETPQAEEPSTYEEELPSEKTSEETSEIEEELIEY